MIEYSESQVLQLAAHVVGNGVNGEKLKLSTEPLEVDNDLLHQSLLSYFLSNFTVPEYFQFNEIEANQLYSYASAIFSDPDTLFEHSVSIASRLYEVSLVPTIKAGDLFVAYITNVSIAGRATDAIGIFKSETKDAYLKLNTSAPAFRIKADQGVNVRKLDKGCLILNIEGDSGYKILTVDARNRMEAQFWMDEFLQLKPWEDDFQRTKNIMNVTRQYIDDQLSEEFAVNKADKIEMMNRSMSFFKSRDTFDKNEFEAEVLEDPSVIESFRRFERTQNPEEDAATQFEISAQAVKRQARVFKSVLKLDKNFHIYIHGSRELIEKGFDEAANKHYYKIYFDEES